MYIDLENINLVLSIILQLILIVGLFVLFGSLISLVNTIKTSAKSVNLLGQSIANLASNGTLPTDFAEYIKNSLKFQISKSVLGSIYKIKNKRKIYGSNSY